MLVYQNILVRMPNWLGDCVMATPLLADLRARWPKAKITAMCQGATGDLLKEDPHLDEIFKFKRPSGWIHRCEHGDIVAPLKQGEYDLGILLPLSFSSAWWFWRGGVKRRLGYAAHLRSWLLTDPVPLPEKLEQQHLVTTYKMLLSKLEIPLSDRPPRLYLSQEEAAAAKKRLAGELLSGWNPDQGNLLIGINPGAAYGSAKCWPVERFTALSQKLMENPAIKLVFFGDPAGEPLVHTICKSLPLDRAINLAGKTTLRELMALIQACSLFLTNDSGPMHIASALQVPLIALFGSTNPTATGPYGGGVVLYKQAACSPCYRRECPIDFRCMTAIGVEEVYAAIQNMLKNGSSAQASSSRSPRLSP